MNELFIKNSHFLKNTFFLNYTFCESGKSILLWDQSEPCRREGGTGTIKIFVHDLKVGGR